MATNLPGLFSNWGNWSSDPVTNSAISHGLLATGLSLLGSRGRFGPALGQAGLGGMDMFRSVMQQAGGNKLRELQARQLQEAMDTQKATREREAMLRDMPGRFRTSTNPAEILAGGEPNKAALDYERLANEYASKGELGMAQEARQLGATPARKLMSVAPGASVIDQGTGQPLFQAPAEAKQTELARLLNEMNALPAGDPRRRMYEAQLNKATTHAPATQVNVNTAKPLLNTVAEGLGKQIDATLSNARAATNTIATAHRLKEAVDSGKLVAGPGAGWRVTGLQLGQLLGVGGKDATETLLNTRAAIQSMAQAELDAAMQLRGQGQITEAERQIIQRASSGAIESVTAPEIRQLADALENVARKKIAAHNRNLSALQKMPGAAPLVPFYATDEPPAYRQKQPAASTAPGTVRRFNPATGKIE